MLMLSAVLALVASLSGYAALRCDTAAPQPQRAGGGFGGDGFLGGGGGSSGGGGGGSGTITGVTAGTGLSGGGTSGVVTLNASNSLTNAALSGNTITKGTGANALANASATDDGTTFTVPEAFTTTGTTTLGDASHSTTVGQNLTSTAGITNVGQLTGTVISPASVSGTLNDWAPTGLASAYVIIVTQSSGTTLTGLSGGVAGRHICLYNTSGSNLTITNAGAGSAAANRFSNLAGQSITVAQTEIACFLYDGVTSLWRQIGTNHVSAITVTNASTLAVTNITGTATVNGKLALTNLTAHLTTTGTAPALTAWHMNHWRYQ